MSDLAGIDIVAAERRIRSHVLRTPLVAWPRGRLWLKCENQQMTGSFKLRGALNKVLGLSPDELRLGLVAASAGNHGIGVALAAKVAGAKATVVVPQHVVSSKRRALERLGADVRLADGDFAVAEAEAMALAEESGAVWISPYNDPQVIAGQGTLGLELGAQWPVGREETVEVYVPVSGGGLLSGVGLGLRAAGVRARLFDVQPENVPYFERYFRGQDPSTVVESPTLADGLAGAVESRSITWEIVRRVADDVLLVSEAEIADAIVDVYDATGMLIEPAAAVSVAAGRRSRAPTRLALLSGGNASPDLLERIRGAGESASPA